MWQREKLEDETKAFMVMQSAGGLDQDGGDGKRVWDVVRFWVYIYTLSIDNGVLDGLDVEMRKREFEDGLSILFWATRADELPLLRWWTRRGEVQGWGEEGSQHPPWDV